MLLEAANLSFRYAAGGPLVLEEVSVALSEGEVVALAGPNGCGKSTLLSLLLGCHAPGGGEVRLGGRALGSHSLRDAARLLAALPQSEVPSPHLTGREMVMMGRTPYFRGFLGSAGPDDEAATDEAMRVTGTTPFASRRLGTLSGGERQLVLLARALAQQPRALLLDEPSTSLDLAHQQQVFRLLRAIAAERRIAVLAVTHDLNLAALYADRLVLMRSGRVVAAGLPSIVLNEPTLASVYDADVWIAPSPEGLPVVGLRR